MSIVHLTHPKLRPRAILVINPPKPSLIFAGEMKNTVYTYHFRRYLGRNLTRAEAAVIAPLEKMRIRHLERRLLVVDPPGVDTRGILCAYVEYLRKRYTPTSDILIMTQSKEMSVYIARRLKTPDAQTYAATGHRPENIRGLTYDTALLFDIQDYGVCSPARKNNDFRRVATAVFPVISSNPNSLLILHARADIPHLHRWPGLKEYTDPSFSPHTPTESEAYGAMASRPSSESTAPGAKAYGATLSRASSESTTHGPMASRPSAKNTTKSSNYTPLPILIPLKLTPI